MNDLILNYVRHNLELLAMAHVQPKTGRMNTYSMIMLVPIDHQNPLTMWNVLLSAPWLDNLSERDILIELYKQIQNQNPFSSDSARNGQSVYAFRPIHTKNFLVKNYQQSLRPYNGFDVAIYNGDENIPIGYVVDSQLLKNLYVGNKLTLQVKNKGLVNVRILDLKRHEIVVIDNNPYSNNTQFVISYRDIIDIERNQTHLNQNIFAL